MLRRWKASCGKKLQEGQEKEAVWTSPAYSGRDAPPVCGLSRSRQMKGSLTMFRTLAVLVVCSMCLAFGGCSGEKQPEADPNFKVSTDPSDITVPPQMMKSKPQAPQP
jgi:hypothetical protein